MSSDISNPATFDLDGWIDGIVRAETTVELYPYEIDYALKVAAIEAQRANIEKEPEGERGITDAGPTEESLLEEIRALRAERDAQVFKVRVQQITNAEIKACVKAGKDAGDEGDDLTLWAIEAACVEPKFTVAQLRRLRDRDRSGEDMVAQLDLAVGTLSRGLPVPS